MIYQVPLFRSHLPCLCRRVLLGYKTTGAVDTAAAREPTAKQATARKSLDGLHMILQALEKTLGIPQPFILQGRKQGRQVQNPSYHRHMCLANNFSTYEAYPLRNPTRSRENTDYM